MSILSARDPFSKKNPTPPPLALLLALVRSSVQSSTKLRQLGFCSTDIERAASAIGRLERGALAELRRQRRQGGQHG